MQRTAKPFNYLPDIPAGWSVAVHPNRHQPYTVWRRPTRRGERSYVHRFEETADAAREYVRRQNVIISRRKGAEQ